MSLAKNMSEPARTTSNNATEYKRYLNPVTNPQLIAPPNLLKPKTGMSERIIAVSEKSLAVMELVRKIADCPINVLITGESGTGKEIVARAIHEWSSRVNEPFIAINCAAIPESLLEAELFGHAKGAFTGANDNKAGMFEEANGGTLFLDEIGDMELLLQAKLLRVIQERKIKRVGENKLRDIDVRIIAATHRSLKEEIVKKRFREDLYFRLNVLPVILHPLRERREDILPLANYFLRRASPPGISKRFSEDASEFLHNQNWPGNARELQNAVERAVVLSETSTIETSDFLLEGDNVIAPTLQTSAELQGSEYRPASDSFQDSGKFAEGTEDIPISESNLLEDVVRRHIIHVLHENHGAKYKTAKVLGIDRKTLYRRLSEYGLDQ